jgi:hypothetical protein
VQAVDTAFSPLDAAWDLDEGLYGGALKQNMAWLCGLLPYGQAAEVMARIGKRRVSGSSLWRLAQKVGQALHTQASLETPPEAPSASTGEWAGSQTKLLSMDGGMVNIEREGWKELKVGLVGTVIAEEPASADELPIVHTTAAHYCAVLGDVSTFTPALLDLAQRTGFKQADRSCITADGAAWIWNVANAQFPDSLQIVDWYHARQHLSLAAQALFPDRSVQANTWFHAHTDDLFDGHLQPIIAELEQAGLADTAAYFQTHQARMSYADFQQQGLPIGSGSVESEVKQFKHRLDGPGMYWSRPGAENMILIRAAVLDGSFDARYSTAA